MKFYKTVLKNFKVLFRLKTSLFAIIFGPLLVIFLIGFAFSSSSNIQISIGYHAPDNSSLTNEFIQTMENNDYVLKQFPDNESCLKELKHGLIHTCVFFPTDFVIAEGKENLITFMIDKSRVNLVYNVIESVSQQIGIKSEELSKSLTEKLTSTLTDTATGIDTNIGSLIKIKKDVSESVKDAEIIRDDLANIDLESGSIDINAEKEIDEVDDLVDNILDAVRDAQEFAAINLSNSEVDEIFDDLVDDVIDLQNMSENATDTLRAKIEEASNSLDDVAAKLDNAKERTDNSRQKIRELQDKLDDISNDVDKVKESLESMSRDISTIEITSSDQIVNPITTKIETISSDSNQLMILFPYVLMLIIMFVGLMLSSTLVVVEKKSRASFRVFTTPTRDEYFILTTFITAFIIVAAQLAIILGAVSYFLIDVFTANIGVNILLIVLASSIFIMIGMAVGYLMNSQQGANMTSISLGAIFLFLSNMVLPIESISPYLQQVAYYNPYVLASEMLRKSILFKISFNELLLDLLTLFAYSVIIFAVIIASQKFAKMKYFHRNPHIKTRKDRKEKGLWIKHRHIVTEKDFIEEVRSLNEKEYNKYIMKRSVKIKAFIKKDLERPTIAKKLRKFTKKELLEQFAKENKLILEDIKRKHEERVNKTPKKKHHTKKSKK